MTLNSVELSKLYCVEHQSPSSQRAAEESNQQEVPCQLSVAASYKTEVLEKADNNDWISVRENIIKYIKTFDDFVKLMSEMQNEEGQTILHLACRQRGKLAAFREAKYLIDHARMITLRNHRNQDALGAFFRFLDGNDKLNTAMHIAIDNENAQLARLLLKAGADLTLPEPGHERAAIRLIHNNMHYIWLELYREPENLTITQEMEHDHESLWIVDYNITPVTGVLRQYVHDSNAYGQHKVSGQESGSWFKRFRKATCTSAHVEETGTFSSHLNPPKETLLDMLESQTSLLSHVLYKEENAPEVLADPLVRIFMHFKCEKFEGLIKISMAVHILWSILTALFAMSNIIFLKNKSSDGNSTDDRKSANVTGESDCELNRFVGFTAHWTGTGIYLLVLLLMSVKEILEYVTCPYRGYYRKQLENVGQISLLLVALVVLCFAVIIELSACPSETGQRLEVWQNGFCATLIFISCLLVMGQFGKTGTLGIYVEMSASVFYRAVFLHLTFLPIFVAFYLTFGLYMSDRQEFGWWTTIPKLFAMMSGELNFNEVFYTEASESTKMNSVILQIAFLLFVVIVMMILANLMVALFIGDVQDLMAVASENHFKKTLETVCILENFLLSKWMKRICTESFLMSLMVDCLSLEEEQDSEEGGGKESSNETSRLVNSHSEKKKVLRLKHLPANLQKLILDAVKEGRIEVNKLPVEEALIGVDY